MSDLRSGTATVTNLSDYRASRLPLRDGETGPGLPPCAGATGNWPAGADTPSAPPASSLRDAAISRGQPQRPALRVGDQVIDTVTRTIAVVTGIHYGLHGAPAQIRIMLAHGSAWRRADKVERLFR